MLWHADNTSARALDHALPSTRFAPSVNHMHFARAIIACLIALTLVVSPGMKAWGLHTASAGSHAHCIGADNAHSKSRDVTSADIGFQKQVETDFPPVTPGNADEDECCSPFCAASDAVELKTVLPSFQAADLVRQTPEHSMSGRSLALEPPPPRSLKS